MSCRVQSAYCTWGRKRTDFTHAPRIGHTVPMRQTHSLRSASLEMVRLISLSLSSLHIYRLLPDLVGLGVALLRLLRRRRRRVLRPGLPEPALARDPCGLLLDLLDRVPERCSAVLNRDWGPFTRLLMSRVNYLLLRQKVTSSLSHHNVWIDEVFHGKKMSFSGFTQKMRVSSYRRIVDRRMCIVVVPCFSVSACSTSPAQGALGPGPGPANPGGDTSATRARCTAHPATRLPLAVRMLPSPLSPQRGTMRYGCWGRDRNFDWNDLNLIRFRQQMNSFSERLDFDFRT